MERKNECALTFDLPVPVAPTITIRGSFGGALAIVAIFLAENDSFRHMSVPKLLHIEESCLRLD